MYLKYMFLGTGILIALATSGECKSITQKKISRDDETECDLAENVIQGIASYAEVANRIMDYVINGTYKGRSWDSLAKFVDKFGNRLSGSPALENAIDYMFDLLKDNGLENVITEEVEVPYWTRGDESAKMIKPREKALPMLGLGHSVATPAEGITAEVVVVKDFDELSALSDDAVQGKIVVYNEGYVTYGETVTYRYNAASNAAKKGAVAALVRSISDFSIATPHTGSQTYQDGVTHIPAAAISIEDAEQMWRMQDRNETIIVHLFMSAKEETRISRNTIGELTGSESPDKIVIVSGHIDSWDVGEGAMDDAGGSFISWIAPAVLKELDLRPRRTLRSILWTAEEVGLVGSTAYEERHRAENEKLNFVMESDYGTFSPTGIEYSGGVTGECMVKEILKLFSSINADNFARGSPGPDLGQFVAQGVPGGGLNNAAEQYFWYHHTEGDTMNVINPEAFDRCAAFWTAFSYIIADLEQDIPRE